MRLDGFRRYFKREVNAWPIVGPWVMFKGEIWNSETDETIPFKQLDDVLDLEIEGQTIREHIEAFEIQPRTLDGGRGAGSGKGEVFKFTSASDILGKEKGNGKSPMLHPAYMNVATKEKSVEGAIKAFGDKYRNADHEYGAAIDSMGFTHKHMEGGNYSVDIHGGKGQIILHNHPSGGNFSKGDMQSVSRSWEKGIVAVGKHGDYIFMKNHNFNATAFEKAMVRARPRGKNYDDAIGKWLTENQKKFGYTYSFNKLKKSKKSK